MFELQELIRTAIWYGYCAEQYYSTLHSFDKTYRLTEKCLGLVYSGKGGDLICCHCPQLSHYMLFAENNGHSLGVPRLRLSVQKAATLARLSVSCVRR